MNQNYTEHLLAWYKFLLTNIAKRISEREDHLKDLVKAVNGIKKAHKESDSFGSDAYYQELYKHIIDAYNHKPSAPDIRLINADFFGEKDFFLRKLPEIDVKEQQVDRFRLLPADSLWLKFKKSFKITVFRLGKIPFYIANLFRKSKRPLKYWNHSVQVQQLSDGHFVLPFYKIWQQIEGNAARLLIENIAILKKGESLELRKLEEDFATLKAESVEIVKVWYEQTSNEFHRDYELVDTTEYEDEKISDTQLSRKEEAAIEKWTYQYKQWGNTIYANYEDWRSKLELSALKSNLIHKKELLFSDIEKWSQHIKKDYGQKIDEFLRSSLLNFTKEDLSVEELKKIISQLTYQSRKKLNQGLLTSFEADLSNNSLLNQLDKFEHGIENRVNDLEEEYAVVKSGKYNEPLADNELSEISNYELLSFEILPEVKGKIDVLKSDIFAKMGALLTAVGDIDEIVNYVLSTASNALNEAMEANEIQNILKEGFERAINANQEIEKHLDELIENSFNELKKVEGKLITEIDALGKKENIAALKLRISKAKALHKSEELSKQVKAEVLKYWLLVKNKTTTYYLDFRKRIEKLNRRFLSINVTDQPGREVSDFLNISKQTIDVLPLIYKRLYAIEPLNDMVLFEGREKEINQFSIAYEAWQKGYYSDVIIAGEKWSGLTSLINYLLKTVKLKHGFVRLAFASNKPDTTMMLAQFAKELKQEKFDSINQLTTYLNSGSKKIIILEDIQNLYLRKIGGQQAIIDLIDIIAATQKSVFWVVTASLYAYRYLEKTIKINAFFSYPVVLENMDAKTISKLIIKRNRVSGFKIMFEPSPDMESDKKYLKLNEEQRQELLRNKFFKELHSFSKSNISMALMYWLLSTKSVDGHSIVIKSFEKPDFSFLNSLQADRVFLLHALILHDGLDIEQSALVLNMGVQKVRFMIIEMLEDGVLIEEGINYLVNPIIFRNTVQLLKDKNLIS